MGPFRPPKATWPGPGSTRAPAGSASAIGTRAPASARSFLLILSSFCFRAALRLDRLEARSGEPRAEQGSPSFALRGDSGPFGRGRGLARIAGRTDEE